MRVRPCGAWLVAACIGAGGCGDRAAPRPDTATNSAPTQARELRAGDTAPDFSLVGSDGHTYRLADYTGRQAIVLAWFSKAFSAG